MLDPSRLSVQQLGFLVLLSQAPEFEPVVPLLPDPRPLRSRRQLRRLVPFEAVQPVLLVAYN